MDTQKLEYLIKLKNVYTLIKNRGILLSYFKNMLYDYNHIDRFTPVTLKSLRRINEGVFFNDFILKKFLTRMSSNTLDELYDFLAQEDINNEKLDNYTLKLDSTGYNRIVKTHIDSYILTQQITHELIEDVSLTDDYHNLDLKKLVVAFSHKSFKVNHGRYYIDSNLSLNNSYFTLMTIDQALSKNLHFYKLGTTPQNKFELYYTDGELRIYDINEKEYVDISYFFSVMKLYDTGLTNFISKYKQLLLKCFENMSFKFPFFDSTLPLVYQLSNSNNYINSYDSGLEINFNDINLNSSSLTNDTLIAGDGIHAQMEGINNPYTYEDISFTNTSSVFSKPKKQKKIDREKPYSIAKLFSFGFRNCYVKEDESFLKKGRRYAILNNNRIFVDGVSMKVSSKIKLYGI